VAGGGKPLAVAAERLRGIEGRSRTKRQLLDSAEFAAAFEDRVDGSGWIPVEGPQLRRLTTALSAYRQAQAEVVSLDHALLLVAGSDDSDARVRRAAPERVRAFLDGREQRPDWLASAYHVNGAAARRKAAELRKRRVTMHRKRDQAAERYQRVVEELPEPFRPRHRARIQTTDRMGQLAEIASGSGDARARTAPLRHDEPEPGIRRQRPTRSTATLRTGSTGARIATLRSRLESEPDPGRRAAIEAQLVALSA
jgi:hypothetical protein